MKTAVKFVSKDQQGSSKNIKTNPGGVKENLNG